MGGENLMEKEQDKRVYETPTFDFFEFSTEDSIATSGASFYEEIWGGKL